MMTRRYMKRLIKEQELEIKSLQNLLELPEVYGLSKCVGVICKACEHGVWIEDYFHGPYIIGCDKTFICQEFKKIHVDKSGST